MGTICNYASRIIFGFSFNDVTFLTQTSVKILARSERKKLSKEHILYRNPYFAVIIDGKFHFMNKNKQ